MTVIGTAEVLVHANTGSVEAEIAAGTKPGLSKLEKDAAASGEKAGRNLSGGLSKALGAVGSVLNNLGVPIGAFGDAAEKAGKKLEGVESSGKGALSTISSLGKGLLLGGAAAFAVFGAASVDSSLKYASATTTVAANAGISVKAAQSISNAFLASSGTTIYSAQQQVVAYGAVAGELGAVEGKALSASQANTVMKASMDLAEGASISLQSATKDTADVMQAYHLSVGQASAATDVLFTTSRVTGLGVDEVASSVDRLKAKLGDAAPSLGQVGGLLDVLAKHGISGTVAMRSMNTAFNTLLGGGKAVTDMAKTLGLQIYDSNGKFVGLQSVIGQLQPKLAGLTQEQQLAATKALFGAGANKQLLDVILGGPAAYDKATSAVQKAGAAHEAAEKQAQTLAHQFDLVKAVVENLAVQFGNFLVPKIKEVVSWISTSITWLEKHKSVAEALAIAIGTVLVGAVGVFIGTTIAEMSLLDAALGGIPILLGILVGGIVLLAKNWSKVWGDIKQWTDDAIEFLRGKFGTVLIVALLGPLAPLALLALHFSTVMSDLKTWSLDAVNFVITMLDKLIHAFDAVVGHIPFFGNHLKVPEIKLIEQGSNVTVKGAPGAQGGSSAAALGAHGKGAPTDAKVAADATAQAAKALTAAGGSLSLASNTVSTGGAGLGAAVDSLSAGGKAATSAANKAATTQESEAKKAAAAIVAAHQKALAEIAKRNATDERAGTSELNKLLNATHSGSLKTLNTVLSAAHVKGMKNIEDRLSRDHTAGLTSLEKKIESAYKTALAAQTKAQAAALATQTQNYRDALAVQLGQQTQGQVDAANAAAQAIADATKVTLDQQAEQGLTGADLIAAQAQTALDTLTANNDAAIAAAQQQVDAAAGGDNYAQALAANNLAGIQGNATIGQAQGQSTLDLATAAQQAAQAAASAAASAAAAAPTTSTTDTSSTSPTATGAATPTTPPPTIINLEVQTNASAGDIAQELLWTQKLLVGS